MTKRFWMAVAAYVVVSLVLGMLWHFVWFADLYHRLGMYNRPEPLIPLGIASMLIQGIILAYLYPRICAGGSPIRQGITFGLLMGLFLYSVSTLANAAKIMVSPLSTWLGIQALFHATQFILAGALIGLAYGKEGGRAR